jgi:translation initiation factor 3 subunit C
MMEGDWKKAEKHLLSIPAWKIIEQTYPGVQDMVSRLVKEETLRVFLLQAAKLYDSLSVAFLCELLDLPRDGSDRTVVVAVSKMIQSGEIHGALDAKDELLVFAQAAPSHLQRVCLQLATKTQRTLESIERLSEQKISSSTPHPWGGAVGPRGYAVVLKGAS